VSMALVIHDGVWFRFWPVWGGGKSKFSIVEFIQRNGQISSGDIQKTFKTLTPPFLGYNFQDSNPPNPSPAINSIAGRKI